MEINHFLKKRNVKNILLTIIEVILVAGIIFTGLMFVYNKINIDSKQIESKETVDVNQNTDNGSGKYYIEINKKKSALIVYKYSSDEQSKEPYKIMKCSIGSSLKIGKYKTSNTYSWININNGWHKYNTKISDNSYFQSLEYKDRYDYTIKKSSYKSIGEKVSGSCVLLYARDAKWINDNCSNKTVVNVIKGNKKDNLPLEFEPTQKFEETCGWDPTDPNEDNPYNNTSVNELSIGTKILYVEKDQKPRYLSNVLLRDELGKNISDKLKYKKISTNTIGNYKIQYTYKTSEGNMLKATQKVKVIDTTSPIVTCSKDTFVYEINSPDMADLHTEANVKAIESMVRRYVSCNESGVTITVLCVSPTELEIGENLVTIKAIDKSGNVGSCQVNCDIIVKSKKVK